MQDINIADLSDYTLYVEKTFDDLAEEYVIAEDTESNYSFSQNTLTLLGDVNGKRILDAGCGFGIQAEILVDMGALVTGVDISQKLISIAETRQQAGSKVGFVKADIIDFLRLNTTKFDCIISFFELMYHIDVEHLIEAFSKNLVDDGQLLVLVSHPIRNMGMHNPPDYFATGLYNETWAVGHISKNYLTTSNYFNIFTRNSFRVVELFEPTLNAEKIAFYDIDSFFQSGASYPHTLGFLCLKNKQ